MYIPRGKEILISTSGTAINDNNSENVMADPNIASGLKLTLDEDINLQLSTNYEQVYSGQGNLLVDTIGSLSRRYAGIGFSSQFKQFGLQVFKSVQPVAFTINLSFWMGMAEAFSGRTEVVNPMRKLINLSLPREVGDTGNLELPGPTLIDLISEGDSTRTLSIRIGNIIRFDKVLIRSVQPTFGKDVDSQGYPTTGKISMEINTLFNATTRLFPLDSGGVFEQEGGIF